MDTNNIDPQVKNLVSAIGRAETGNPSQNAYSQKGKSGEFGRYQFMPDTWKLWAKQHLGDQNAQPTIENQNKVAYMQVKQWKDDGLNPAQIASKWNSGNKNAYKENHKGTNKQGVSYDTPAYTQKVSQYYEQLKGGQSQNLFGQTANAQSPDVSQETQTPTNNKDLLQKTGDIVNTIFPGKQTGEAIGTLGGLAYEKLKGFFGGKDNSKYYDTSAPTPLQVAGDVAQGALTVAPGLGAVKSFGKTIPALKTAGSVMGRIGQAGLIGAGIGGTQALKEGSTDLGKIGKQTAFGGLLGGALGGIGEAVSKIAQHFPKTMIQGKFEGLSDAEAQKFLNQKIGTQESLLNQTQKVVETEGNKIDTALQKYNNQLSSANPFSEVLQQFPEYQNKEGQLVQKIKSFISQSSNIGEDRSTLLNYIDKIVNGEANLFEKNQVRKVLDLATKGGYAKLAKSINPSAGHDLVMTFADALRNEIKGTAKETIPMFEELQKSVNIRNVVRKVANKKGSTSIFRYSDIIPFLGGNVLMPGVGGIGAVLASRAAENPATRFAGAKLSRGLLSGVGTVAKSPITTKQLQGLFGGNANVH